ncbi:MAG: mercuric transporter MerT family protein [Pseudomonadota bacterium]
MSTSSTRLSLPALVVASLAGLGASVCCLLPLILVSAGIGGAWMSSLAILDPWRPWFTAAALVALAAGAWAVYRPLPKCVPGSGCERPQARTRARVVFWIGATLVVAMLAFPTLMSWML